jgi:hypothetical protein
VRRSEQVKDGAITSPAKKGTKYCQFKISEAPTYMVRFPKPATKTIGA